MYHTTPCPTSVMKKYGSFVLQRVLSRKSKAREPKAAFMPQHVVVRVPFIDGKMNAETFSLNARNVAKSGNGVLCWILFGILPPT